MASPSGSDPSSWTPPIPRTRSRRPAEPAGGPSGEDAAAGPAEAEAQPLPPGILLPDGRPDDRLHVVIDTREQKGWTFEPKQVRVSRRALREGDYTVAGLEGRVALERKSLGDLVQTVVHDWIRFRKELVRLSGYDVAAVVVEADLGRVYRHEYESEALPASVLGRVNGIYLDHGIPVLWWGDRALASDMAHRFLLQAWRKLHHEGGRGLG